MTTVNIIDLNEQYSSDVDQYPVLSEHEEHQLAVAYYDHNDLSAAKKLILHNLKFVLHIANGYRGYGLPVSDLVQEGNIGLMKAVHKFNPYVGVRLVAYASHWIKSQIHDYVIKNWSIVKIATTKAQRKLFFNIRKASKKALWLSQNEINKVSEDLNVEPHDVTTMELRLAKNDLCFEMPDDDGYSPSEYLTKSDNPYDLIENAELNDMVHQHIKECYNDLDDRNKDIVSRRWFKETPDTLSSIAKDHSISVERVRQLEKGVLNNIKKTIQEYI